MTHFFKQCDGYLQEYLQGSLANLLSMYVLKDKTGVAGQVILQLGCTETALLRSASRLSSNDMTNLPPSDGTTLYKLISDPDAVTLDNLSMDALIVCHSSITCYILYSIILYICRNASVLSKNAKLY